MGRAVRLGLVRGSALGLTLAMLHVLAAEDPLAAVRTGYASPRPAPLHRDVAIPGPAAIPVVQEPTAPLRIDDEVLVAAGVRQQANAPAPQIEEVEPGDDHREQADGGARDAFWLFGLTALALLVGEGTARIVGRARRRSR